VGITRLSLQSVGVGNKPGISSQEKNLTRLSLQSKEDLTCQEGRVDRVLIRPSLQSNVSKLKRKTKPLWPEFQWVEVERVQVDDRAV